MSETTALYGIDAASPSDWDRLGIKRVTPLCAPPDPITEPRADRRLGSRRTSDVTPRLPALLLAARSLIDRLIELEKIPH